MATTTVSKRPAHSAVTVTSLSLTSSSSRLSSTLSASSSTPTSSTPASSLSPSPAPAPHLARSHTATETAILRHISRLSAREKQQFTFTSVDEVLDRARRLERRQASFSRTRRASRRLEPLVAFLLRYAKVVDALVQYDVQPSALAWGCLRFLLNVAGTFNSYFSKLLAMMEKIGDFLPTCQRYEEMYADSEPFRAALANVYNEILSFLCRATEIFKRSALKTFIRGIWKPFETEFDETLSALSRHRELFEAETTLAHRRTVHVERRRSVMEWLAPVDTTSDFRRACGRRAGGTGRWLVECDQRYRRWRDGGEGKGVGKGDEKGGEKGDEKEEAVVWVNGGPGTGKTVLCAAAIEDLQGLVEGRREGGREGWEEKEGREGKEGKNGKEDGDWEVAYFFFDKNHEKKTTRLSLISTLTAQLVGRMRMLPPALLSAYEAATKYGQAHISSADDALKLLRDVAAALPRLYIVLDGLDECSDAKPMLDDVLSLVSHKHSSNNIRLLCFSRDNVTMRTRLAEYTEIKLTAARTQEDIDTYLHTEIAKLSESLGQSDLCDLLFARLSTAAHGGFLWVYLMLQTLRSATSRYELSEALNELPHGLAEVYESILRDLRKEHPRNQRLATKLFLWVCSSSRPLSWAELECALALEPDADVALNPAKKPFKSVVLRLCSPLIEYQPDLDVFRPVHLSVCEYLLEEPSFEAQEEGEEEGGEEEKRKQEQEKRTTRRFRTPRQDANCYITQACLTYLSFPAIAGSIEFDPAAAPLTSYATSNWCQHLTQSPPRPALQRALAAFMASRARRRIWLARWLLLQISACPLQHLLKQQRSVQEWMKSAQPENTPAGDTHVFDVLEDMFGVLLDLDNVPKPSSPSSSSCSPSNTSAGFPVSIGYFEKMMVIRDLARAYTLSGRLADGTRWLSDALQAQQARYGADAVETVWILNALGLLYDQESRFSCAVSIQQSALRIQQARLPPNHLDAVWTINELGRVYRHLWLQGGASQPHLLADAEKMHLRALRILQTTLQRSGDATTAADDVHIVWTENTLARTYRLQHRTDEALRLHRRALDSQTRSVGAEHPHTLWTLTDVARCYRDQGRVGLAYECQSTALAARKRVLGERHADTLWSMNDVALLLARLGRRREARALHEEAYDKQRAVLGEEHAHTVWTREVLENWTD